MGVRSPGPFASTSTVALGVAALLFISVPLVGVGLWRAAHRDEPPAVATDDTADACRLHLVDVRATGGEELDVFVVDRNLVELRRITHDGQATGASMSPDGACIAVSTSRDTPNDGSSIGAEGSEIYLYPSDGDGPAEPLSDGPVDRTPDWSPDGTAVVYAAGDTPFGELTRLEVADVGSGETAVVYESAAGASLGWPRWSPDGRRIAFIRIAGTRQEIWTVGPDGGSPTDLGLDGFAEAFDWSPDGRQLVVDTLLPEEVGDPASYEELDDGLGPGLRRLDVATGGTEPFAGTAGARLAIWTPDGLLVTAMTPGGADDEGRVEELHLVDPVDGERRTIGEFDDATPSGVDSTAAC